MLDINIRACHLAWMATDAVGASKKEALGTNPPRGNWCARVIAEWCLRSVIHVPSVGPPSRGAKAITRFLGDKYGYRLNPTGRYRNPVLISRIVPGDVIAIHRGMGWTGHVMVVCAVDGEWVYTVGGNERRWKRGSVLVSNNVGGVRVRRRKWKVEDLLEKGRIYAIAGISEERECG